MGGILGCLASFEENLTSMWSYLLSIYCNLILTFVG